MIVKRAQERSMLTVIGFAVGGATLSIGVAKKIGLFDAVDQMMSGLGGSGDTGGANAGVEKGEKDLAKASDDEGK